MSYLRKGGIIVERTEIIDRLKKGDLSVVEEAVKLLIEDEDDIMSLSNQVQSYMALYRGVCRELKAKG